MVICFVRTVLVNPGMYALQPMWAACAHLAWSGTNCAHNNLRAHAQKQHIHKLTHTQTPADGPNKMMFKGAQRSIKLPDSKHRHVQTRTNIHVYTHNHKHNTHTRITHALTRAHTRSWRGHSSILDYLDRTSCAQTPTLMMMGSFVIVFSHGTKSHVSESCTSWG